MTSRDSIKMKDIMSREFNTSKKYSKVELSKFSSPDQVQYGLTSNKKPLTQISSSRENYGDVEESKVHDARIINNLDESGITQMDDYLKMKPHEVAANLLSAGLSTKGLNKDMSQNIMIYKEGISRENEYIPRNQSQATILSGTSCRTTNLERIVHSGKPVVLDPNYKPCYSSTEMQGEMASMNRGKLIKALKKFKEYPDKYRTMIWKYMLSLPMNKKVFESYIKRDPHPAYAQLYKTYSVKSYRLYNKLVRILSALAHWCPLFAEVSYLPDLVFPFVKAIKYDDLVLFEVIVSFLMQHCQLWFERFPHEPLFAGLDVILAKESILLYKHFNRLGFGVAQYAWPMLKNGFSIVLPRDDWLKLFDHLLTYHDKPDLLLFFTAAYLLHFKGTLTKVKNIDQMCDFVESQNQVDINHVLKEMLRLHKKYSNDNEVQFGTMGNFTPLKAGHDYPVFFNYPKDAMEYSQKMRINEMSEYSDTSQKEYKIHQLRERVSMCLSRDGVTRMNPNDTGIGNSGQKSMTSIGSQGSSTFDKATIDMAFERLKAPTAAGTTVLENSEEKMNIEYGILQRLKALDDGSIHLRNLESNLQLAVASQNPQ